METHISIVCLAGEDAYKLKRAVAFDFLDFSTPERRRRCCEDEVRLNRRTAPALYKGVLPVTQQADGSLALGGTGEAIDWVVHMRRFDQSQLFDRLAIAGALPLAAMDPLGRAIAKFHRAAVARADRGGARGMRLVIDGNAAGLRDAELSARTRAEFDRCRAQLEDRRRFGYVRECHGDLHLGNIVMLEGVPTLFDAIEFNDDIACVDVLYDLAFVLMDLRHRALPMHANALLNAYLEESVDYAGLSLLPLFMSCRAAVRAKITAASAAVQHDASHQLALTTASQAYRAEALRLLEHRPRLAIAIGGVSGTGKSTTAAALAPSIGGSPGAVVLRSDVIRKQLCAAGRFDHLGPEAYTNDVSARVYRELCDRTRSILHAGHSVVVDAAFLREGDRKAIAGAARDGGVALQGFWLDAPDPVLIERLKHRLDDPSDADAPVLAQQRQADLGVINWPRVDAENSDVVGKILGTVQCNGGFPARPTSV